jgi:hypothetical protein
MALMFRFEDRFVGLADVVEGELCKNLVSTTLSCLWLWFTASVHTDLDV